MNSQYDELNSSLIEDVRRQISENGDSTENAFTSVFISYLTEQAFWQSWPCAPCRYFCAGLL